MSDNGTGVTIAFDSYLAELQNVTWSGISREVNEVTTTATTGGREFEVSDLYDGGEISAEILFSPADVPDILVAGARPAQACVVTWSDSGTTTYTTQALMSAIEPSFGNVTDRVTASVTLKITGDIAVA